MRAIDEVHLKHPFYGSRRIRDALNDEGHDVGRDHVRTLMRKMGIEALYRKPNLSKANPAHKVYPYLLRELEITRANQVWATDITYIPMARGFAYLVAIMDWHSRRVLSWRLSNTLDTGFCIEALQEAIERYGVPEIFNTDQGSRFTSAEFTDVLKAHQIQISMDGKGRWIDNVFVERLWWSLRGSLSVRLRLNGRSTTAYRRLDRVLQHQAATPKPESANAGSGVLGYTAAAGVGGMSIGFPTAPLALRHREGGRRCHGKPERRSTFIIPTENLFNLPRPVLSTPFRSRFPNTCRPRSSSLSTATNSAMAERCPCRARHL